MITDDHWLWQVVCRKQPAQLDIVDVLALAGWMVLGKCLGYLRILKVHLRYLQPPWDSNSWIEDGQWRYLVREGGIIHGIWSVETSGNWKRANVTHTHTHSCLQLLSDCFSVLFTCLAGPCFDLQRERGHVELRHFLSQRLEERLAWFWCIEDIEVPHLFGFSVWQSDGL